MKGNEHNPEQKIIKLTIGCGVEELMEEAKLNQIIQNYAKKIFKEKGVRIPNFKVEKDETLLQDNIALYINEKLIKKGKHTRLKVMLKQIEQNLEDLLFPQDVDEAIEELNKEYPYIRREMKQKRLDLFTVHKVLKTLVKEDVSISPFKQILESIIYHYDRKKEIDELIFLVRIDLTESIIQPYIEKDGYVYAMSLRMLEENLETYSYHGEYRFTLTNEQEREIVEDIHEAVKLIKTEGLNPVLVVNYFSTRSALSKILSCYGVKVPVLTSHEITFTSSKYNGVRYLGELEPEELPEEEDKEVLRQKMLDLALTLGDEKLFLKLSGDDWEKHL